MKEAILEIPARRMRVAEEFVKERNVSAIRDLATPLSYTYEPTLVTDILDAMEKKGKHNGWSQGEKVGEWDAWMAPRVHALFRLPRRVAARSGVWAWAAADPMRRYMDLRWSLDEPGWRFHSTDVLRNGISRLWWGAEMLRSGRDYSLVRSGMATVRRFQFVSELRYSWHREAARAFARVVTDRSAKDDQLKGLSKRFNVYLKTQALELWDDDAKGVASSEDASWISSQVKLAELTGPDEDLFGPSGGVSRLDVEEELYQWLSEVYDQIEAGESAASGH
ncbi:MAG: DUF6339 family protein [Pseudomonadota bacterium]